jgi:putative copper resistance protein D
VRTLYLFSVWLHIIAATIWVGGMLFLTLVVVPWLRGPGRATGLAFLRESGRRFRNIAWVCFAVFAVTGAFNLSMRGVGFASFLDADWRASSFGTVVLLKLVLMLILLGVMIVRGAL